MRKSGFLLLVILFLTYGYQGYKIVHQYISDDIKVKTDGRISDIAGHIAAIPLQTPDSGAVRQIRRVQKDGDFLFMIADRRLLQFDTVGNFIRQLTTAVNGREEVFVADYTLDTDRHQVVVIDSQRNICKFDYFGNRITTNRLNQPWYRLTALAYHNGCFWVTAEKLVKNADNPESYKILHSLYCLDRELNELSSRSLHLAEVGRDKIFHSLLVDELLADEYGVYAYTTPADMAYLLSDTLHILQRQEMPFLFQNGYFGEACIYPVRKGKRHLIASYYQTIDDCYTFCYDHADHTAYMLPKGFKDDVNKTGYIADFQPMDVYSQTYCFLKSGAALAKKFPDRAKNDNSPVLFIVTLKS